MENVNRRGQFTKNSKAQSYCVIKSVLSEFIETGSVSNKSRNFPAREEKEITKKESILQSGSSKLVVFLTSYIERITSTQLNDRLKELRDHYMIRNLMFSAISTVKVYGPYFFRVGKSA